MPSLEEVLKFREAMHARSMAIISKKGHDYNRQQQDSGNTLFNLQVAELLGIVPTAERGILVRLSDKFMRLISLMTPGAEPQNPESLADTVADIHNYVDYALQLHEERQMPELPQQALGKLPELPSYDSFGSFDCPGALTPRNVIPLHRKDT